MKNPKLITLSLAAATTLLFAGCGQNQQQATADDDHAGHDHSEHAEAAEHAGDMPDAPTMKVVEKPTAEQIAAAKAYPLDKCIVSDEALGSMGEPIVLIVGDQQVKLCCNHCLPDVKKDPAAVLAKLSESQKAATGSQQ